MQKQDTKKIEAFRKDALSKDLTIKLTGGQSGWGGGSGGGNNGGSNGGGGFG